MVAAPPSSAAAPAHDDLADALAVSLSAGSDSTLDLTTAEATREGDEPTPCGTITSTVWVAYTAVDSQLLTVETSATTPQLDTVLAAHTAATPGTYPLTTVGCNDDATGIGRLSRLTFPAAAGTTYYLQVGHYGGAPQSGDPGPGPLQLHLSAVEAAPHDDASTPTGLGAAPGTISVDTTHATHGTGDPSRPTATYRSLWYSFEASADGAVSFEAAGSTSATPDTLLYAFPATGPTTLADALEFSDDVDEDGGDRRSRLVVEVVAGQTYRILAGTRDGHGEFTLSWQSTEAPTHAVHDDVADATVLDAAGTLSRVDDDLQRASAEPRDPDLPGTSGGFSLWYRWTAPADGPYRFATAAAPGSAPPDTVLAVFAGTDLGALGDPVAFDDDADGSAVTSRVLVEATAGTTYSVMVDGWPARPRGPFTLTWGEAAPEATTTTLTAVSPVPGVVDLTASVARADGGPGTGSVRIRDGAAEVARLDLVGGTAARRLRGQAGGPHSYTAEFVPDTSLQAASTSAAVPVSVVARPRPANDDFANATALSGGTGTAPAVDLLGASRQLGEPVLDGDSDGASVWYRWTAPVSDSFTFTASSSDPAADTLVGALRGSQLRDLTVLRSARAPAGPSSSITFSAIGGRAYYLLVDAVVPGTASLAWTRAGGTDTTLDLTRADSTAPYTLRLEAVVGGAAEGTVVFLRDGAVVSRVETVDGHARSDLTFQRPGASTVVAEFYPAHDGVRPSSSQPRQVTVSADPPPANDPFASARTISGPASPPAGVAGTTQGATADAGTPPTALPSVADTSVWYRWVAPSNGSFEFTATPTRAGTDTVLRVFEGTALAHLRPLAEDDDGGPATGSLVGISAAAGHTYHLLVDAYELRTMGPFTLTWEQVPAPLDTTTALTGSASGRTVTLRAVVDDPASDAGLPGQVEFFDGTVSRGVVPVTAADGLAVRTLAGVRPGGHTYRAVFVPDDHRYAQSTSPDRTVTVRRVATRTTLAAPTRVTRGARPVVTATVRMGTARASGSVTFTLNGRTLRTKALRRGRVALRLPALGVGPWWVTATYLGNAVAARSSATRTIATRR